MSADTSEQDHDFESLGDAMTEKQATLLSVIDRAGDEGVASSDAREQVGIPSGSSHYHFDALRDHELIEIVDKIEDRPGIPENIWRTTDLGSEFLETDHARLSPALREIDRLESRVDELEDRLDEASDKYGRLAGLVRELKAEVRG